MGMTQDPWTSGTAAAAGLALEQVAPAVLDALADGDLDAARAAAALELTPYLAGPECVGVWRMRRDQIARSPADAAWVTRLLIDSVSGKVVGRAGYHGPPDDAGMVEIGYSIDPAHRRRGYARGALVILLETANRHPEVAVVRASVRPDNLPSRRLLDQYGFQAVGEQWDDEDGLETILEVSATES
ncbi:GNAT family N-acetyltransferase [Pseudarthrobacter sp. O4]|uniref:GNAT family N-acetyltransferase n=1 Tax=Pseudarthrobacter sp. O4 TaxID=3418417 RepID=UPI003CF1FD33